MHSWGNRAVFCELDNALTLRVSACLAPRPRLSALSNWGLAPPDRFQLDLSLTVSGQRSDSESDNHAPSPFDYCPQPGGACQSIGLTQFSLLARENCGQSIGLTGWGRPDLIVTGFDRVGAALTCSHGLSAIKFDRLRSNDVKWRPRSCADAVNDGQANALTIA